MLYRYPVDYWMSLTAGNTCIKTTIKCMLFYNYKRIVNVKEQITFLAFSSNP